MCGRVAACSARRPVSRVRVVPSMSCRRSSLGRAVLGAQPSSLTRSPTGRSAPRAGVRRRPFTAPSLVGITGRSPLPASTSSPPSTAIAGTSFATSAPVSERGSKREKGSALSWSPCPHTLRVAWSEAATSPRSSPVLWRRRPAACSLGASVELARPAHKVTRSWWTDVATSAERSRSVGEDEDSRWQVETSGSWMTS